MKNAPAEKNVLQALAEVDSVLFKTHLDHLGNMDVVRPEWDVESAIAAIRLGKLHKLVYDPKEDNLDKLNSVLAAMHIRNSSVVICIDSDGTKTDLHLGVRDDAAATSPHVAMQTLQKALCANFPGFKESSLFKDDIAKISRNIRQAEAVASLVGVPSLKDQEKKTFVQGLEKLIEGMSGQRYTALVIADPVPRQGLELVEASFHQLYSALSFMAENQITLSENESLALGQTLSKGITETLTQSIAQSQTITEGTSTSLAKGKTQSLGMAFAAVGAAIGSAFPVPVVGSLIGAGIGGIIGGFVGSTSKTATEGKTTSSATGSTNTESHSKATTTTEGTSETKTSGTGKSLQFTIKDRRMQEILAILDEQLERIRDCKNYGMWQWGAYFIGESRPVVSMGAAIYSGILSGQSTGIERSAVTLWDKHEDAQRFSTIMDYLSNFRHPVLQAPDGFSYPRLTPCALVSTPEAAVGMSLPQKSLPGIPVIEMAGFGRSVSRLELAPASPNVQLGVVCHLDALESGNPVELNVDSLAAHVFITGSTGAGKSNTILSLLHTLWTKHQIPFLVIEPAKGEYKDIAGGWDKVCVLGTNPFKTPLLRINPFSFPEDIHVVEHIDRLIEILNAVWPMYAAMPAILKEAVELAYERLGWNLLSSRSKFGRVFPDFHDLLEVLPEIIDASRYSDEMKGNYTGALLTRVRSLTNGYYRSIFQKQEHTPEELFDRPCIVDLSRVGSSETKAMLMGMVFMKLQEYRMSARTNANATLQHLTVMEEAHTLLRRTSVEQNQEGANLQGKSVEMISKAIAEMRTYGQGFIIAYQAPGLLDPSVIRNTNTKIILRLPDWEDRQLVGRAANLTDDQLAELARLGTGCAAVYQNNWAEAVLCQCEAFSGAAVAPYDFAPRQQVLSDSRTRSRTLLAKMLLAFKFSKKESEGAARDLGAAPEEIYIYFPQKVEKLQNDTSEETLLHELSEAIEFSNTVSDLKHISGDHKTWTKQLIKSVCDKLDKQLLDEIEKEQIIHVLFEIISRERPENAEQWMSHIENIDNYRRLI